MDVTNILTRSAAFWPLTILTPTLLILILWRPFTPYHDPREPPVIKPRVPIIGHLLGLLQHQIAYLNGLSAELQLPIYTLPILSGKMYVLNSLPLFQSAMRAKELQFEPILAESGARLHGLSPQAMRIWGRVPKDRKEPSFLREVHKASIEMMKPGPVLQRMNAAVLRNLATEFNKIGTESLKVESLWLWLRDSFTVATSTALFGSRNPLKGNPGLVESFWDFETDVVYLLPAILPSVIAPKAYKGRSAIWAALTDYFIAGHDSEADVAPVIKSLAKIGREFGFQIEDMGHFNNGMLFAATSNAAPTIFWLCLYIFADPKLLENIRSEVAAICTIQAARTGTGREATIDVINISTTCPILLSAYQEVLRLKTNGVLARLIEEDTILTDSSSSYLLKKGFMLQIPTHVLHTTPDIWGEDANSFNAARFLTSDIGVGDKGLEATKEQVKLRKKALNPFGGGAHLCPGRHFAFAEIMGLAALLAVGFDVTSIDGGTLKIPVKGDRAIHFGESVVKPGGELQEMGVGVSRRKGWEDVAWGFSVGDE